MMERFVWILYHVGRIALPIAIVAAVCMFAGAGCSTGFTNMNKVPC